MGDITVDRDDLALILTGLDDYWRSLPEHWPAVERLQRTVLIARCPVCGEKLYQINRGATLQKRGNAWRCPVDIDEVWRDERGRLHRKNDARHAGQVWLDDEVTWKQE